MAVIQFEGDNVRYFGNGKFKVFRGQNLTDPIVFGGCPAPPPPNRGPYLETTVLRTLPGGVQRPVISAPPAGVTLDASGLTVAEPDVGFDGVTRFVPFEDSDLQWPGQYGADAGALTLRVQMPSGAPDPVNSALIGLYSTDSDEWIGLGVLGSGTTGTIVSLGAALQLAAGGAPDPLRVLRTSIPVGASARWITLRWSVTDASAGKLRLEGFIHSGEGLNPTKLGGAASLIDLDYSRWVEFLTRPGLRVGLIMHVNSIRSESGPAVVHSIDRVRLGL